MPKKANKAKRGKDKYYQLAKEQGYRARSAFKLIQLNKKYDFLASAGCVIDLCAAPGGWLQVAAKYMPKGSTIIGVDLMPIKPIRGVITHTEDITTPQCRTLLKRDMGGRKADVILHDGAPNVGQNWSKDAYTQSELVLCSLKLATEFLKPHGLFITKVFRSIDYNALLWVFNQFFGKVEATKPHSSRNASAEIFVTCRDYKAPDKIDPKLLDPRFVFKDTEESAGTGSGVAGGGGSNALPVLDRKALEHNKRNRDGYDETLGPLLTRAVPVATFLRAENPVRILTDASRLVFDDASLAAGVKDSKHTTPEVVSLCADLKVLGKGDFKTLLKWRWNVRRDKPAVLEGGEEEEEGDDGDDASGDEEDAGSAPSDDEEAADMAELSAAAREELHRRKKEKKRVLKARAKAMRKLRSGANLVSVDLLDTDETLFNLSALTKLAKRSGGGVDGDEEEDGDVLAGVRDVDGDADPVAIAAAAGPAALKRYLTTGMLPGEGGAPTTTGGDDEEDEDAADGIAGAAAGGAGTGDADDDEDADADEEEEDEDGGVASGEGSIFDRIRAADKAKRIDDLEGHFDQAYAIYIARKSKREADAAAAVAAGEGPSKGIKLSRMQRLKQQAVLTQAALEGQIEAEHQRYVKLLGGVRAAGGADALAATAGGDSDAIVAPAVSGVKRKRPAAEGEEADEDVVFSSDDEDDDDDDDDEEDSAGGGSRSAQGGAAAKGGLSAATRASRWFSAPIFGADAGAASGSGGDDAVLGLGASSSSSASGGAAAGAASRRGAPKPGSAAALDALIDDDEEEEDDDASGDEDEYEDDDEDGDEDEEEDDEEEDGDDDDAAILSDDGSVDEEEEEDAAPAPPSRRGAAAAAAAAGKSTAAAPAAKRPRLSESQTSAAPVSTATGKAAARGSGKGAAAASGMAAADAALEAAGITGRMTVDDDGDAYPNWLADIPKSEREKRKDRLRKQREREAAAAARRAAADAEFEVVGGTGGAEEDADVVFYKALAAARRGHDFASGGIVAASSGSGTGDAPAADEDADGDMRMSAAKRDLIRRGMGSAAAGASVMTINGTGKGTGDDGFEVVRGRGDASDEEDSDTDSDDEEGEGEEDAEDDPRLQHYDEDTHAEMLALGKMLKRHTTGKALVDASYNRYAFDEDDDALPSWFAADEARHAKPQLPVSREQVEAMKARFRDIAARPIARVAEARARKHFRAQKALAKARKAAENVLESEELQGRSRAKALARIARKQEATQRPKMTTVVARKSGSHGDAAARARKGGRMNMVDPREKKDRRAMKRAVKRSGGGRGGGGGGGKGGRGGKGGGGGRR